MAAGGSFLSGYVCIESPNMRDRTFFGIVLGCFFAGMVLAASFVMSGAGQHQPVRNLASTSK